MLNNVEAGNVCLKDHFEKNRSYQVKESRIAMMLICKKPT